MKAFLVDYKGNEFELPVLFGWSFSYGRGLPCDAFWLSFAYGASMLQPLQDAVGFRAEYRGNTVFRGVVDEFEVSALKSGGAVTVSGRGMAALLLDNEAEAAELYGAGLQLILDRYVRPFGISDIMENVAPPAQSMVVSSGSSCWKVLEDFLWFGCGQRPWFSRDGVLVLGDREGDRFAIELDSAVLEQTLKMKRYGVISQVLVKNKALGTSSVVDNSEFLARGGRCRRVVNVPRYTRFDAMRSTGSYQINQSRAEEFSLSLTLPSLFAAFPGDVAELKHSFTGLSGSYKVGRTRCFATPQGGGTEIILTGKES